MVGVTKELKNLLLKTQKELKARDERFKKHKTVHDATKREYQTLYKENIELKKKLQQYENYFKNHQKEKTKRNQDLLQQQQRELESYKQRENKKKKEETNILDEIGKLRQLDLLKVLAKKRKNNESSDKNEEEEDEIEEEKPTKKKKRRRLA